MDSVGEDNGMNGMNLFSTRKASNPWTRFWIGLGLAVGHWSLAAYLPVVGPRALRFDVKTSSATTAVILPPLKVDEGKVQSLVVETNQPVEHANENTSDGTHSGTPPAQRTDAEMAVDMNPVPVVVDVTPVEPYGPPVANSTPDVGPQRFIRFFQVRGTNGTRLLTAPNLFNPPVALPAPSSTTTYEVR